MGKGKKKGKGNGDQPSEGGGGPSGGAQPQRQPAQQQQQARPPAQQQQARPPAQQQQARPPAQQQQARPPAQQQQARPPVQQQQARPPTQQQQARPPAQQQPPRQTPQQSGFANQGGPGPQQQQRWQQGGPGPQQQQQPQQGGRVQQQQQRWQQGGPGPQQQQRPQQGGRRQQQQRPQSGFPPPQQQQGPTHASPGPPGFATTPQALPPHHQHSPSPVPSVAEATQQMQQINLGGPSQSTPPGFFPPQQPAQQKSPSPEKSASVVDLGLVARGRDYPAINGLLPPKRNDRPPMKKTGRVIIVETNHLPLSMKNTKKPVYHYDVKVEPEKPFRFYRPALRAIREVLYPNNWPSFDGKKNLYSAVKLPFRGDSATETVQVFDEERGQPKDVTVTITLAAEVSMSTIGEYFMRGSSTRPPQDAIQALDVCLRQPAAQRFLQVGRSYFSQPRGRIVQLGDGLNLWYGFFQSAILGWRQPFLNIDVAHKGFPAAVNCIQALEEFVGGQLRGNDTINDYQATKMRGLIKGLKIIYEMPKSAQRRTHKVLDLGKSARETRFTVQDRGEMTVEQYFRETYDYQIRFPLIPCLKCGSQQREFSLPAELCRIMEGQIVLKKLNEIQTRTMVKEAATPAPNRRGKIMESMVNVRFEADPHIQEFGLSVSKEFKKVEARVLNAPQVHYSNKKPVPVYKGVWMSSSFIKPGSLSNWVIYCCERRTRPNELDNLERELIKIGGTLGMSVNKARIVNLRNDDVRQVERDFASFQKDKVQLLFVILPDRGYVTYAKIKSIAEIQVGVLTQCLKYITITRRLNPATVTNILLKVNAKINGINHNIVPEFWPIFLKRPVMVVGADVTHPSPDQQDIPSVAAVAASHDASAFHYNMKWRLQQPREEMIQDLETIMKEQLMFFYRRAGYKPEHILFYRDGVSEGQFKKVLDIELQAIRRACKSIGDDYEPPITFLVVQKRHHTRFFPTNQKDADGKNQNVPAGTIVDTDIVHPTEFDFYLVSHASIQGTSRPTKYHVLWDDAKMPEQLLEEITYYLCHLFTRCTRSVSYPAPTYYAHLAAFRIRSYIENQNIHLRNLPQEEKNRTVKQEIVNNNPMFFV